MGLLSPYRVLDFTDHRGELGPMLLGDLGADVIRIEPPAGSPSRRVEPVHPVAGDTVSLSFLAFNRNKRSIALDPKLDPDQSNLEKLIAGADFVFDSAPGGGLDAWGLTFTDLSRLNPNIVFVRLSPFGIDGPRSELLGNDLVLAAMGGPVSLQGVEERAPVRVSVPQVWRHAGAEAAAGALVAHRRAQITGEAQFVDLSAQCVMTWTMLNAMDAHAIQGDDFQRGGGFNTGTTQFDLVFPCADGYVLALPNSKVILACLPGMVEAGIADASLYDIDWAEYDLNIRVPDAKPLNIYEGADLCRAYFARHTKTALFEHGMANGVTIAPINTLEELLDMGHMEARGYWTAAESQLGEGVRRPGLWAKSANGALSLRQPAPNLGAHTRELRDEAPRTPALSTTDTSLKLPFEGITVADFSWVGVGPISAKYLADHGARVIRIESETRPDVLRGGAPFKDREPGLDRSQFYGDFNTSKEGITLDLKHPQAIEIARRLATQADVVIESFAPGAIARMGLDYASLVADNPGLIMISTCLMGQTGPAAQLAGYGYHAGAIAGFYEVTGWPDLAPSGPWVAYTDTIAPRFVSTLLAAALDHRRRTGEGGFYDVAQIETALHFLGPELMEQQLAGTAATRIGNRSVHHAPQGCYPCVGEDEWCAVAIDDDHQWQRLCGVMGHEDLAGRPELGSTAGRQTAHNALDQVISEWTSTRTAEAAMAELQAAGVPAGKVQRSRDLLADPQYAHRSFYRWYEHPVMGEVPYAGHQYRIAGYDNGPRGPAPTLGQHSYDVLQGLLGLDDEQIAEAFASGAIS